MENENVLGPRGSTRRAFLSASAEAPMLTLTRTRQCLSG
jgi:hypothetical protein